MSGLRCSAFEIDAGSCTRRLKKDRKAHVALRSHAKGVRPSKLEVGLIPIGAADL